MKNLIINIFKTLFFFDLAVIVISFLPVIEKSDPALTKLISEGLNLAVIAVFTFVFILFVEKKKITLPLGRRKIGSVFIGIASGLVLPVVCVAVMVILKDFDYIGLNKISSWYYWILALFCNAVATELMLRGYLFSLYKKYYNFTFAMVVTTLMYLSLNIKILSEDKYFTANIILFNILLCFLLEYSRSVIVTITARFTYTLISTFLLGSYPLTGGYPILINHTVTEKEYITGAGYLLENNVLMLGLVALITLIFAIKTYHPIKLFKRFIAFIRNLPKTIREYKIRRKNRPKKIKKFRVTHKKTKN